METSRAFLLLLVIAIVTLSTLPCSAQQKPLKDEPNIWIEQGPRKLRTPGSPREPRGPRHGPGRQGRKFELTDEEIDQILKSLNEIDPAKAEELQKLRKEDLERFQFEIRRHGGEQFGRIVRQRIERWRNQRRDEFLQWLEKNYNKEAKELSGLKEKDAKLYWGKSELINRKYWPIFEEEKKNPELAEVLKEDLELKKRRDGLLRKIKSTNNDKERKDLTEQLEEVVGRRFDLIIRRKQIEYERLLKRIEQLQKELEQSKAEIDEWRDEKTKKENVTNRVNELTGAGSFNWD